MQDFNPISPLCGCCMFLENVLCTMVTFQVSKDIKSGLSDIISLNNLSVVGLPNVHASGEVRRTRRPGSWR